MIQDVAQELLLTELVCSRICHDLVGPVGAINAGAELMGEGGVNDQEALALMQRSGQEAARRLQLFRLALGRAGNRVDVGSMRDALMRAYETDGKIHLRWQDIDIDATHGRLVLNMVMLAREALPFGGEIDVFCESDGRIRVDMAGKKVEFRPEIVEVFKENFAVDRLDPRTVHAFFTRKLAGCAGGEVSIAQFDGKIALLFA